MSVTFNTQNFPVFSSDFLFSCHQFSSVQSLSRVRLFVTPWITARQASLSITKSRSSLRLTSIKSVMPSGPLILCYPLLLLPQSLPAYLSLKTLVLCCYLSFVLLAPTCPSGLCSGLTLTPQVSFSLCFMLSQWPVLFLQSICQSF